jgi:hypothetical protein
MNNGPVSTIDTEKSEPAQKNNKEAAPAAGVIS